MRGLTRWLAIILAIGFVSFYLSDLARVPFHGDESTYLFMSRDFQTFFLDRNPAALAWRPGQPLSRETTYRLLDAPLHRYLIGLGWWLAGYSSADLNDDFAWDQTWQENLRANRIPQPGLLWAGRIPVTVLGALSVALLFWLGASVRDGWVGLLAAVLLGLHPLMLLHARRAMAEGPMLFTSTLTVLGSLQLARWVDGASKLEWPRLAAGSLAAGALLGLAVSSKHSAAVLGLVAALPVALALWQRPWSFARRLSALALAWLTLVVAAGLVFFALNPVLYRAPLEAVQAMAAARSRLVLNQTEALRQMAPYLVLPDIASRVRAAILELYLQPPAVWDVPIAIHLGYLAPQAEAYSAVPFHQGSPVLGATLAGLTIGGLAFSGLRLIRDRLGPATRTEQVLWVWGLATLGFAVLAIPFGWQRYFLPLLPPVCLFAAIGAEALAAPLLRRLRPFIRRPVRSVR